MKLYFIFALFTLTVLQDHPSLKLGQYESFSVKKGNGFVTVLKNNVIYVEFGSCYGDRYCKGTYKIKADTLIATITQEDKSERKSNKYIPITPFDLKFLIRPKLLICSNCPSPTKVDTIWFSRPVFQKSK